MQRHYVAPLCLTAALVTLFACRIETASSDTFRARDPGVRATVPGNPNPGNPLPDLTKNQQKFFDVSSADFEEEETVSEGLGPTMNLDSCGGCHAQPAVGERAPVPIPRSCSRRRTARTTALPHSSGRTGRYAKRDSKKMPTAAPTAACMRCSRLPGLDTQEPVPPTTTGLRDSLSANNVIFRIPTPVFERGLIEQIPDSAIRANQAANATAKRTLGIRGRSNIVLSGSAISGQPEPQRQ